MTGYQDWVNGMTGAKAFTPGNTTGNVTGVSFDTIYTEGQLQAVVVGAVNTGTYAFKAQESTDGTNNWTDVTIGDTATLTTGFGGFQAFNVMPTKRYVRLFGTGASSPDATIAGAWQGRKKYQS